MAKSEVERVGTGVNNKSIVSDPEVGGGVVGAALRFSNVFPRRA